MKSLPELKEVIDSIGDGVVEITQVGGRLTKRQSDVAGEYADRLKSIAEEIKARMPDDPSILPKSALKAGMATASAILGAGEGIVGAIQETASGVRKQINRVIRR